MQGHIIGVDEFLELCKHWKRITDKFPEGWVDPKPNARQMVDCQALQVCKVYTIDCFQNGQRPTGVWNPYYGLFQNWSTHLSGDASPCVE